MRRLAKNGLFYLPELIRDLLISSLRAPDRLHCTFRIYFSSQGPTVRMPHSIQSAFYGKNINNNNNCVKEMVVTDIM